MIPRWLNLKNELFASTFSYGATAVIKLISSLILTRMLSPETYGIFGILLAFLFAIEMLSDVGMGAFLIRHPRGNDIRFVHTLWTIKLIRAVVNCCLLCLVAPLISRFYHSPVLTPALRTLSVQFLIAGVESMAYVLAMRDQKARIINYAELISNAVMAVTVIGLASVLRNHFALIYGVLLQRALMAIGSHFFYRNIGVGIAFDREAIVDQFRFARYVTPSSLVTLVLSQWDKIILLRLTSMGLLGVYTIASNIVAPLTGMIIHNARAILYARCAAYFRADIATARSRYYAENKRLFTVGIMPPAIIAGLSQFLIALLYDPRYMQAGHILMILGLGTIVAAAYNASESLLFASGRTYVVLAGNVVRLVSLIPASLAGYYFFGFAGFLWCNLLAALLPLAYFYLEQWQRNLWQPRSELGWLAASFAVFLVCLAASHVLLAVVPADWLHLHLRRH